MGKSKGREAERMNRYPTRGAAYRGRVLMAMRVEPRPPSKLGNRGKRRFGSSFRVSAVSMMYTHGAIRSA